MRGLNYNHLHYFWVVAREGSVTMAAKRLHLTPQTISGQLNLLEQELGEQLFRRAGRRLELTPAGELAFRYADDMFSLGAELRQALGNGGAAGMRRMVVGAANVVPKLLIQRLLAPALRLAEPIRLVVRENNLENLIGDLITHRVDVVLADRPVGSATAAKAFNHLLGESGISFFATPELAASLQGPFPRCLNKAPFLLPALDTYPQRLLEGWFEDNNIVPLVVGEFDDSGLLKAFGEQGVGIFPAPSVIEDEVCRQYAVQVVGRTANAVRERYYAILADRKQTHPGVRAVIESAGGMRQRRWPSSS
jgi:LysR family transcriptional activator of nhaA